VYILCTWHILWFC